MITAEQLRGADALTLLAELGYPVHRVEIPTAEWRRAGIDIGWNGELSLALAVRLPRFDCYVLTGEEPPANETVTRFLRSLAAYNVVTKFVAIYSSPVLLSIYDLSPRRELRRLDVDLHQPSSHALDRLNLLAVDGATDLARVYDRALDREGVTRQFFERFRSAVSDVVAALRESLPHEGEDAAAAQSLLLLSRLLFLYFIQEKGWLNGQRRFLADRLDAALTSGREFFSDVLTPLFFGCLNTARDGRDPAARELGAIPYLNGGLFEPSAFERRNPELHLPNELLARVIDGVFEKFAFSSDERDAAGTHVDPEMLGKVFESLMAAGERAASGSFYTPRPIVDVLTSRALIEWCSEGDLALRNTLEDDQALIDGDTARKLLRRIDEIAVLDPACGSGAFLLSSLAAIERLTKRLQQAAGEEPRRDLRQRIVEHSLYGVDLKPEAVRLCELRLWLAIVSGNDVSIDDVRPLPNLDRNILQGNSLLSPTDFLGGGRADVYHQWAYALRTQADLLGRYRNATHEERPALYRLIRSSDQRLASELLAKSIELDEHELQQLALPQQNLFGRAMPLHVERCRELQERIAAHRHTLERVEESELEFFSFDVHFAHVLARGGFDLVVGNPPWIRSSRIDPGTRRMYSERYRLFRGGDAAFHQPDVYVGFVEKALSLAAESGVVSMLIPSKALNAAYAAPLRAHLQRDVTLLALDDWSDDAKRLFDADTFPLGVTVTRARSRARGVRVTAAGESFELSQSELPAFAAQSEWALVPPDVAAILRRLREHHLPLEESLARRAVMGVKTGDNSSFFLDAKTIRGASLETTDGLCIPLNAVCRLVRGRDLRRWHAEGSVWMLWPPAGGWRRPPQWLHKLAEARGVEPRELRLSYVRPEHAGIKVAWKDLSRGLCAAVLPDSVNVNGHTFPLIPNQTLYSIDAVSLDEAYVIAAVLNSTIVNALALCLAERAKDYHFRYFARTVGRIPLPRLEPASSEWSKLVRCSRRAHQGASVADDIDEVVASLYGVTEIELQRLRDFVQRRLGLTPSE